MIQFSFLLPTRDRPGLLRHCLDAILRTTSDPRTVEVVLYVDDDDQDTADIDLPALRIVKLIGSKKTMGEMTRECYAASTGRHIVLANDDMSIRTKDWDIAVQRVFARLPDRIALVYGDDGYYGQRVCTFPILSREACEAMGGVIPPEYRRHCIDSHLFDVFARLRAMGTDRMMYLPEVRFEHMNLGALAPRKDDEALYAQFAEQRAAAAERLARAIGLYRVETRRGDRDAVPVASVILLASGHDKDATACLSRFSAIPQVGEIICLASGQAPGKLDVPRPTRRVFWDRNQSVATAVNAAARLARFPYLVFIDAAFLPSEEWLPRLLESLADGRAAIVGSRWIDRRTGLVDHIGLAFYRADDAHGSTKMTRLYRGFSSDAEPVSRPRRVQAVELSGMSIASELFFSLRGLADDVPGFEAVDLCLRAALKDPRPVLCAPSAQLYCAGPSAFSATSAAFERKWAGRIELDLERVLKEDSLHLDRRSRPWRLAQADGQSSLASAAAGLSSSGAHR